jgi:hypothetical protein
MLVCSCIYPMQLCVCSRGKFEQAASCKPQTWYPRTSGHSHLLSPKTAQYPTIECWWFKEPHREACRPQTPICAGWWQCHNNDYSIVDVFFFAALLCVYPFAGFEWTCQAISAGSTCLPSRQRNLWTWTLTLLDRQAVARMMPPGRTAWEPFFVGPTTWHLATGCWQRGMDQIR